MGDCTMSEPRAPKPSPFVGEGAEPRGGEAGEGSFAKLGEGTFARPPSPGRSSSGGALRRPAASRPPSPTRGEGKEPAGASSTPIARARALRARMTDAERKLWFALRDRRFASFKFRRQVPIGSFIADFICYELRVVIEVDGGQHSDSRSDQRRDGWFARNDFLVLRFWNNDVLSNREGVLTSILEALHSRRKQGAKECMP
jgi:very-short-patch-repair endonuclease